MAIQSAIILLLFGYTSTTAATASSIYPNGCPKDHSVHLLLPHETDCTKFYYCDFGLKVLRVCGPGTHFDVKLQTCNWPQFANCQSTPTPAPELTSVPSTVDPATPEHLPNGCPADFHIHLLLPHETDCRKFYQCSNGVKILSSCDQNTLFDVELQVCNWPHAVRCPQQTTTITEEPTTIKPTTVEPTTAETTTVKPKPTTTTTSSTKPTSVQPTVAEPSTEQPVQSTTVVTTTVEPATVIPTTTEDVTTTDPSTIAPGICPDGFIGNVPHPGRCDLFYFCSGGPPMELPCTPGFEFDPEVGQCVEIAPGGCTLGDATTTTVEPSTVDPTTVVILTDGESETLETTTSEVITPTPSTAEPTTIELTTEQTTTVEPTTEPPVTESIDSTTTSPHICPDGFIGYVPHPERCDLFYFCSGGPPMELPCTAGFEFDLEIGQCVEIAPGGCTLGNGTTTTLNPITEDPTTVGLTTETDLETVETTSEATTPELTTVEPSTVDLTTLTIESSTTIPTTVQLTTVTEELTTVTYEQTTAEHTTKESNTVKPTTVTEKPTTVTEESSTIEPATVTERPTTVEVTTDQLDIETTYATTTSPQICPDGFIGYVPHPERCDWFYFCSGGPPMELPCTAGFEFDLEIGQCVEIAPGGCTLGNGTTTTLNPITEDPTTVGLTTDEESETVETTSEATTPELTTVEPTTVDPTTVTVESSSSIPTTVQLTTVTDELTTVTYEQTTAEHTTKEPSTVTQEATIVTEWPSTLEPTTTTEEPSPFEPTTVTEEANTVEPTIVTEEPGSAEPTMITVAPTIVTEDPSTVESTIVTKEPTTKEESSTVKLTTVTEKPTTVTEESSTIEPATVTERPTTVEVTTDQLDIETTYATTTSPQICPDGFIGYVPHPERCDWFYFCSGGPPMELPCTAGFEFDLEIGQCVEIAPGGCTLGNGTTTTLNPITENPTTVGLTTDEESETVETTTSESITPELSSVEPTTVDPTTVTVESSSSIPTTVQLTTVTDELTTVTYEQTTAEHTTKEPSTVTQEATIVTEWPSTLEPTTTTEEPSTFEPTTVTEEANTVEPTIVTEEPGSAEPTMITVAPTIVTEDPSTVESTIVTKEPTTEEESSTVKLTTVTEKPTTVTEESSTIEPATVTERPTTVEVTTDQLDIETTYATTTSPQICPDGFIGYVPHPERCDWFYFCSGGPPMELPCTAGFEFDLEIGQCVEIAPGGCTLGNGTTVTDELTTVTYEQTTAEHTTKEPSTVTQEATIVTEWPSTLEPTTTTDEPTTIESTESSSVDLTTVTKEPTTVSGGPSSTEPITVTEDATTDTKKPSTVALTTVTENPTTDAGGSGTTETTTVTQEPTTDAEGSGTTEPTPGTVVPTTVSEEPSTVDFTTVSEELSTPEATTVELITEQPDTETTVPITTPPPVCPDGYFGIVPHPERCDVFFFCSGGIPTEVPCQTGYEFDPETTECVEIAPGGCTLGVLTTNEPSTLKPTTVEPTTVKLTTLELTTAEPTTVEPMTNEPTTVNEPTTIETPTVTYKPSTLTPTTVEQTTENPTTIYETTISEVVETTTSSFTTTDSPTMTPQICPDGFIGNVAHPEHCNLFFFCSGGPPMELPCTPGFEFNAAVGQCTEIAPGGCTLGGSTTVEVETTDSTTRPQICPDGFIGNVAHPEHCNLFFFCSGGPPMELPCTPGFEFDVAVGQCTEIAPGGCTLGGSTTVEVETTDATTRPQICPDGFIGNVAHPEHCNLFFFCSGGPPMELPCTPGFEFDVAVGQCTEIAPGGCTLGGSTTVEVETTDATTRPQICPDGFIGNVAHPEHCNLFFFCSGGPPMELPCTPGFEFNAAVGQCTEIAPGGCTLGGSTTVEVETTDATTRPQICPDGFIGNVAHPEHCNLFFFCSGGPPMELPCTPGFEFDVAVGQCTEIAPGGCTLGGSTTVEVETTDATTRPQICPDGFIGNVAHPEHCNLFFFCSGGPPMELPCTPGFEFDVAVGQCTEIAPGGCTLGGSTTVEVETTDATTRPQICPDGFIGNVAHPEHCNLFFFCSGGPPMELPCTPGFEFDVAVGQCTEIAPGGCTLGGSTTVEVETTDATTRPQICPDGFIGNVAHPEHCNLFFFCSGGPPMELPCTPGFEFNAAVGQCTEIAPGGCTLGGSTTVEVETTDATTRPQICPDGFIGNVAHPEHCNLFFFCSGGPPMELPCTPGFEFDVAVGQCTEIAPGGCTLGGSTTVEVETTDATTRPQICPDGFIGNVAHPEHCNLFFFCSGGPPMELPCTPGFEFNAAVGQCTEIAPGGCTLGGSTTVEVETTDATIRPQICPDGFIGNVALPEHCNFFFLCNGGPPMELSCVGGLEFDPTVRQCMEITPGGCTLGGSSTVEEETTDAINTPLQICPDGFNGNMPHPERCDLFYLCSRGTALQASCIVGFEFNPGVGQCVAIAEGGCTMWRNREISEKSVQNDQTIQPLRILTQSLTGSARVRRETTEVAARVCGHGYYGHVAHPELCNAFYMCTGDAALQFYCGTGFEFSTEAKSCVEISDNGCIAFQRDKK